MENCNNNLNNTLTMSKNGFVNTLYNKLLNKLQESIQKMEDSLEEGIYKAGELREFTQRKNRDMNNLKQNISLFSRSIIDNIEKLYDTYNYQNIETTRCLVYLAEKTLRTEDYIVKLDKNVDTIIDNLLTDVYTYNLNKNINDTNETQSSLSSGSYYTTKDFLIDLSTSEDDDVELDCCKEKVGTNIPNYTEKVKDSSIEIDKPNEYDIKDESNISKDKNEPQNYTSDSAFCDKLNGNIFTEKETLLKEFHSKDKIIEEENTYSNVPTIKTISCRQNINKNLDVLKKFTVQSKKDIEANYLLIYESKTPCTLHYFHNIQSKFIFLGETTCKIIYNGSKKYYQLIFEKPNGTFMFHGTIEFIMMPCYHILFKVIDNERIEKFKIIFNVLLECDTFISSLNVLKKLYTSDTGKKCGEIIAGM